MTKKNFVFYTSDGYCTAPSGAEIDNLQILGFVEAVDVDTALKILYAENSWIVPFGYKIENISWKEVV